MFEVKLKPTNEVRFEDLFHASGNFKPEYCKQRFFIVTKGFVYALLFEKELDLWITPLVFGPGGPVGGRYESAQANPRAALKYLQTSTNYHLFACETAEEVAEVFLKAVR